MNISRVTDILEYQLKTNPLDVCVAGKNKGEWVKYSTQETFDIGEKFALGLLELGIKKGDKIGLISNNRPEWIFIDRGISLSGCTIVPIYPTITDEDYTFILAHAEIRFLFVSSLELYNRISEIATKIPCVENIFIIDEEPNLPNWKIVLDKADLNRKSELKSITDSIKSEELCTIIYTSGTTGRPKGVMLSHKNLVSNVLDSIDRVPCNLGDSALSFLPLCHSFERIITFLYMYKGIKIYYAESLETIGENLKEIKPHVFSSVPRLLEKVYDKIVAKGYELTGFKKALFFWALSLASKYEVNQNLGVWYNFKLWIANKLIFNKWREALGGNVRCIVTGAAALQVRLARIFWGAQIPVVEGYGLTETSPVIAVNYLQKMKVKFGTVGPVIPNVTVKIAEDGEILCKGPNVMMGYYKSPEQTAEMIDSEGWLHTGDIGELTKEGYLKITDRKKEIFKTSGGKYIAPQPLENKLKESVFIDQAMIIGENEKYPAALIVPAWDAIEKWCARHEIDFSSKETVLQNKELSDRFAQEIEACNGSFAQWEKVKNFKVLPVSWGVDTGELTPTMKLKRKFIMTKFKDDLSGLF